MVSIIAEKEPLGVDVVFECSGDPQCVDEATQILAPGGTLVLVGIPPGDFPTPLFDVVANCITIRGSFVGNRRRSRGW